MTERFDPHVEEYRQKMEAWRMGTEAENTAQLEVFKSTIEFAKIALKGLLAINGAAAIAILAFLSHAATSEGKINPIVTAMIGPLTYFAIGASTSVLAAGFAYLAQHSFTQTWNTSGIIFQVIAILAFIAGLVIFVLGCVAAGGLLAQPPK